MNDRTRSAASNGSSRTTRSSGLATSSSSANNGSKTSLFRSHFIRRPNAASSDPENVRLDVEMQQSEPADLVVRDQHGEVEIGNPPTPVVDDEEELQALEYQQENESEEQLLLLYICCIRGLTTVLLFRREAALSRGDSTLPNQPQLHSRSTGR